MEHGRGFPVLLLHGWPGFWYDWRRVIPELTAEARLIAPDLRGFGASAKPDLAPTEGYTPRVLAADLQALLDFLEVDQVLVAAHDLGATVAQALARQAPERVRGLVLFNPPYPGIGTRRFEPSAQREFWYQHFHQLPLAEELAGYDRETVRIYLRHFYSHWTGQREALDPQEFEAIVDEYARPGALSASLRYYRARADARTAEASGPAPPPIEQPTVVRWGDLDPVIPLAWSDRLGDFFLHMDFAPLSGVGHFVPWEAPAQATQAIRSLLP